jgi:3-hydroxybutyryl-CoA dehydrogenase
MKLEATFLSGLCQRSELSSSTYNPQHRTSSTREEKRSNVKPDASAPSGDNPPINRVLVVGAGIMGSGIAQVVAESAIQGILVDADKTNLRRGLAAIESHWQRSIDAGRRTNEEIKAFRAGLCEGDLALAADVDLVIEAIVEKESAKSQLLSELSRVVAPTTLFASNTSSISITALGRASGRPERLVGLHFFNPVPRLPLVEVVRGLDTSDETVERAVVFARKIGKTPVVVYDSPGFVANRILLPMINEAIFTLQDGVASRDAIDEIMRLGAAHPMGPLALADLIGLDVCLDILETLHRDFGDDKYRPAPLLRRMVAGGKLGRKSREGFYSYATA